MGITEYAFAIKNITQLNYVLNIIKKHNEYAKNVSYVDIGEEIDITCYLNYKNECYLIAINGGGNEESEKFFASNIPSNIKWYGKFKKPVGFSNCNNYICIADTKNQYEIPNDVIEFLNDL